MDTTATGDEMSADALELPDDLRIPLHGLQADAGYLIGRVRDDGSVAGVMLQSLETRLSHVAEAAYRLNGERADLLAVLRRVEQWIKRLPIPTKGATAMLCEVQPAIAKAEGR